MWLGIFLAIAIMALTAVQWKKHSDVGELVVNIEHLKEGYDLIKDADVKKAVLNGLGFNLRGLPVEALDVERIERVLEEEPFVKTANVYVDANNQIQVNIIQREPLVRVIDINGSNYYLDAEGVRMPPSKHYTARVVVATGNIPPYSPDFMERKKYLLKDLFLVVQTLMEHELMKTMTEQIFVNNAGDFILIPKIGDQKIMLGGADNLEDKLRRLEIFYKEGIPYEGWNKYSLISVKYRGQIVCKKR